MGIVAAYRQSRTASGSCGIWRPVAALGARAIIAVSSSPSCAGDSPPTACHRRADFVASATIRRGRPAIFLWRSPFWSSAAWLGPQWSRPECRSCKCSYRYGFRARGLAVYMITFTGSMAVVLLILGVVAQGWPSNHLYRGWSDGRRGSRWPLLRVPGNCDLLEPLIDWRVRPHGILSQRAALCS